MNAILLGSDTGLGDALEAAGVALTRIDEIATESRLESAGVEAADLLVVCDTEEATAISIAKSANPDLEVVLYTAETMPEFVRGQVDIAVDPGLLSADVVAEELIGSR